LAPVVVRNVVCERTPREESIMWTRWPAAAGAAAVAAGLVLSCATAQKPAAPPADPIARGAYLSIVGGCNDCHTPGTLYGGPDTTRLLSGSELGWTGAWGTTYARNLTPDVETGIGSWSEADIIKALKLGQRPDGSPLLPPMPWPNYSRMTDEDLAALAAYLKSIPAVKHVAPQALAPGRVAPAALVFPPIPAWDAPRASAADSAGPAAGSGG
jgi:mono/diheme cytochrome c family protein